MIRALVIDDDPLIAAYIQELEPGWHVTAVPDGRSAIQLLQRLRAIRTLPDIVVLDIAMPHIDGYDTCVLIRTAYPSIPILPFTSLELETQQRLLDYMDELGCNPVVPKGVPPQIMRQSLSQALAQQPGQIAPGPGVLQQLQAKAHTLVRCREAPELSLVGFASTVASTTILQGLLQGLAELILVPTLHTVQTLMLSSYRSCIAGVASDVESLLLLAEQARRPVLVIATSTAEARSAATICGRYAELTIGLVCAHDSQARERLAAALSALAQGISYRDACAATGHSQSDRARLDALFNDLPPRLREVVVLHTLGSSSQAIARQMAISAGTLNQYWKRIYARLESNRHEIEERARRALA